MNSVSRRNARVLCVLAVLIGLFGMHGMASADAGGCHQLPGMTATAPVDAMAPHVAVSTMAGASCEFVAPAGWPPLVLALLVIVAMVALSGIGRRQVRWLGGRSPPDSGTSLLRRVCVSRT